MTLLFTLTNTQITIAWIAYLITWVLLFLYARRWSKKKIKQAEHAHQMESTTLPEPDNIPWRELGMEYDEYPYVKLL